MVGCMSLSLCYCPTTEENTPPRPQTMIGKNRVAGRSTARSIGECNKSGRRAPVASQRRVDLAPTTTAAMFSQAAPTVNGVLQQSRAAISRLVAHSAVPLHGLCRTASTLLATARNLVTAARSVLAAARYDTATSLQIAAARRLIPSR